MTNNQLNLSTGLVATGHPLAIQGYDPVSYFTETAPQRGLASIAVVENGATYYFASQANADAFSKTPAKYLPTFGGFCAYGVSVSKKFDGDPTIYKIVDGRLHLNLNPEIHQAFLADLTGAIGKADKAWTQIADKSVGDL